MIIICIFLQIGEYHCKSESGSQLSTCHHQQRHRLDLLCGLVCFLLSTSDPQFQEKKVCIDLVSFHKTDKSNQQHSFDVYDAKLMYNEWFVFQMWYVLHLPTNNE